MPCARRLSSRASVSDRDAVREAGRAARILKIGDVVGLCASGSSPAAGSTSPSVSQSRDVDAGLVRGAAAEVGEFGRVEEQRRVAALQLDGELVDIGFAPAEAGRQRQRHRPGAGIDRAEEGGGEFRPGLGDQSDAVAGLDPERR